MTAGSRVGGLVGANSNTINDCHALGSVTGSYEVGGLAGTNQDGVISRSYATGDVTGTGTGLTQAGGLVGFNFGDWQGSTVRLSYATGNVIGIKQVGGLVGANNANGRIERSYATGSVTGERQIGGLVGANDNRIAESYATGLVVGNELVGGLIGHGFGGSVLNSYWDMDTTNQIVSLSGIGKATLEMIQEETFTGWDFDEPGIWNIIEGESYPYFQWQKEENIPRPEPEQLERYHLLISSNPDLGGTAEDVTGEGPYPKGSIISINAVPNPGYQFDGWTATEGGTFEDDSAAATLFTMPGRDTTATANYIANGKAVSLSVTGDFTIGANGSKTYRAAAKDAADNPVEGVEVIFLLASEDDEDLDHLSNDPTATVVTDADGQAVYSVTANDAIMGHRYTLTVSMDESDSSVDISQTDRLDIGVNKNIIRGGPAETNPLAVPIQITGVNANAYNSDLNQWTGSWQAPQTIYDQGDYVNDPDFWSNVGNSGASGSTWYNPSPGTSYGILVVDLLQMRNIRLINVFQMFSDGKITHIAIEGHGETSDEAPDAFDSEWVEVLGKSVVEPGGNGGSYGYNPTKFNVDATTRYVKIMAYNDGSYGHRNYIEIKGIKMYE